LTFKVQKRAYFSKPSQD